MKVLFNQRDQLVGLIAGSMDAVENRQLLKAHTLGMRYGTGTADFTKVVSRYVPPIAFDYAEVDTRLFAAYPARVSVSCNDPRFRGQLVKVLYESRHRADIETADGVKGNISTALLQTIYPEE